MKTVGVEKGGRGGANGVVTMGTNGSQAAARGAAFNLIVLSYRRRSRTQWLSLMLIPVKQLNHGMLLKPNFRDWGIGYFFFNYVYFVIAICGVI